MKRAVLPVYDTTCCRICGASEGKRRPGAIGDCCERCWKKFEKWGDNKSENEFNRFAARELFMSVRRMEKFGMATRCEAIAPGNTLLKEGYQCCQWATTKRGRHKVCWLHANAKNPIFVTNSGLAPYEVFRKQLAALMRKDDAFRNMIGKLAAKAA